MDTMKTHLSIRTATIAALWFAGWVGAAELATPRTYCRFVPERSDFAWENDKVPSALTARHYAKAARTAE